MDTKKVQLERQLIGRGKKKKQIVCERTSIDANEVRGNSLVKVPKNDIEIGEATAVRFAKIRI